ncbi:hypothetical protein CDL15_Pgr009170 [Punica granatum]|uniref:Uncharacterized protein n=1 Tax=Punica granatum TaxID=22663 RepID=A0A218WJH2_PUNGR|nr:hypothetical protein CDL15_Pgr009170 [Punica granatum]
MLGQGPKTVNSGLKPDAVNAGPKPKCGAEAQCNKCGAEVRWESARNAKAKVNAEEQRRALQSGDFDLFAVFVKRWWELNVEIPRS